MTRKQTLFVILALALLIWGALLLVGCAEKKKSKLKSIPLAAGMQIGEVKQASELTVNIRDGLEITKGDLIAFAWGDDDRLYLAANPHGSGPRIRITSITFDLLPEESGKEAYVNNYIWLADEDSVKVSP